MEQILLGKAKNKLSVNEDNFLNVELSADLQHLPVTEDAYTIDAYEQYFREKDDSEKYRLAFTISPVCSNVLFNMLTEPVYKEGSEDCFAIISTMTNEKWAEILPKLDSKSIVPHYKGDPRNYLRRNFFISDTTYSLPIYGNFVYHPGYDIFNNHYLRKREYSVINPIKGKKSTTINSYFNTITDYLRDSKGNDVKDNPSILSYTAQTHESVGDPYFVNYRVNDSERRMHVYSYDNTYTYLDSISYNLEEVKGWFGFRNKSNLKTQNLILWDDKEVGVYKCLNNRNINDFIDMYPDRTLYSFVPKYNEYRHRQENNWDYCITYPSESVKEHDLVSKTVNRKVINGLRCVIKTHIEDGTALSELPSTFLFKSFIRHNLSEGDSVTITFINENNVRKTGILRVVSIGNNGYDAEHYFSVETSGILNIIAENSTAVPIQNSDIGYLSDDITESVVTGSFNNVNMIFTAIMFRKNENGEDCQYYLRKFAKIFSVDGSELSSSINKLAFSQNAYGDQNAQILFTEDINVKGMKDNLGRQISELYLTIIKRNKGFEKWYGENKFSDEDIEFSHCFGTVSAGLDLPVDIECKAYNVHRIHNIENSTVEGVPDKVAELQRGITIDDKTFYGDLVEYLPSAERETTIEDVYFRFNTAQRETLNDEYKDFIYTDLTYDDYDYHGSTPPISTDVSASDTFKISRVNVFPEGYYYKAHYKIKVRDFKEEVNEGNHINVKYDSATTEDAANKRWKIKTKENYYFQPSQSGAVGSTVYVYKKSTDDVYSFLTSGTCEGVSGEDFTTVEILFYVSVPNLDTSKDYRLFRQNTEMPDYAYDLEDGSGRYVWRDILPFNEVPVDNELYDSQFTNGAHYHHKNINFYLKRQDPTGEYGLGTAPSKLSTFVIENNEKDVSYGEYKEGGNVTTIC